MNAEVGIYTLLFYIAIYDIIHNKIPNRYVIATFIGGLSLSILTSADMLPLNGLAPVSIKEALLGCLVGLIISVALYSVGIFAAGDAKLLAALGAFVGINGIVLLIALSLVISGCLCILKLCYDGKIKALYAKWYYLFYFRTNLAKKNNSTYQFGAIPMAGSIFLATLSLVILI
ncbi:prepilin peptidase [Thaumasiovibrio sp. DFM-14]|uniref:prepilin peptidase n=1 Tax=Thaumasiovibrio sp. DFM-14 TaxID=3384792 RepID=UPI0039A0A383